VFVQRVAVAAVAIPLILLVVYVGGPLFHIVIGAGLAVAALELYHAMRGSWLAALAMGAAVSAALLSAAATEGFDWLVYTLAGVSLASLAIPVLTADVEQAAVNLGGFLVAVIYCGFLGAHFILLRDLDGGRELVFLVLLATYTADSFAYFAGKTIGRHKFSPRISPNKTWEGTAAAMAGGFLAVILLNWWLDIDLASEEVIPLAILFPVFCVVGDLAESVLKRSLGVKDTSGLIPGHGGVVDRLDSLLFTAVLVFYWVWLIID
jgi:phosphatidate cytidylyltransferase